MGRRLFVGFEISLSHNYQRWKPIGRDIEIVLDNLRILCYYEDTIKSTRGTSPLTVQQPAKMQGAKA